MGRRSESQHDLVEPDFVRVAVEAVAYHDTALLEIDLLHLALEERYSLQEFPRRIDDIRQIEISGRDLMKHRCKQKEVLSIYKSDVDIQIPSEGFLKLQCRVKASESSTKNHDFVFLSHHVPRRSSKYFSRDHDDLMGYPLKMTTTVSESPNVRIGYKMAQLRARIQPFRSTNSRVVSILGCVLRYIRYFLAT